MLNRNTGCCSAFRRPNTLQLCAILIFAATLISADYALATSNANTTKAAFTAADSISSTVLIEPDLRSFNNYEAASRIKYSGDHKYFVIVTKKGNLATASNDYQLYLYEVEKVLQYLSQDQANEQPPKGNLIAQFSSIRNDHGIRQLRWLNDNRTLAFIGESGDDKPAQVYIANIETGKVARITDHPRSVESFDLHDTKSDIVFLSTLPYFGDEYGKDHYLVGSKSMWEEMHLGKDQKRRRRYQYYAQRVGQSRSTRAMGDSFVQGEFHNFEEADISLSPNGKWAIVKPFVRDFPENWVRDYLPMANTTNQVVKDFFFHESNRPDDYFAGPTRTTVPYFALIDLQKGTVEQLINAPSGYVVGGYNVQAQWLPNGDSVILANTFLPLDGLDEKEWESRRRSPKTIEYNVKTKVITQIMDHAVPENESTASEWFAGMEILTDRKIVIFLSMNRESQKEKVELVKQEGKFLPEIIFEKQEGIWVEAEIEQIGDVLKKEPLDITVVEDLNTPPNVHIKNRVSGRVNILVELNPQYEELTFGRTEVFSWSDASGSVWKGGLVYPPNFETGKRYPLVIQMHGFDEGQFLIEGPGLIGSYAAQALANRDILVLQMQNLRRHDDDLGTPRERETHREGVEAAVDKLDQIGLIDKGKVGLVGFSRTGHYVQDIIMFSDYDIAAATIADAVNIGYSAYIADFGNGPYMVFVEGQLSGAVPWGEKLDDWVRLNPSMYLDLIKTPLRLQQYTSMLNWWDVYAILRRQYKPVEWIVLPDGTHNLVKSNERYIIQQGNVDWFDFWLNGHERREPYPGTPETRERLEEQYQRWRKLRELQEESNVEAIKAREWHKEQEAKREQYQRWLREQPANDTKATTIDAVNQ